jgi:cyclopropane fatty-acyl-phospholipid synthase-like methyltransferase
MSRSVHDFELPHLGGNLRHGDLARNTLVLWKTLVDRFAVRSMLDVGCGEGHAVWYFHQLGVFAHGIDGLPSNVTRAVAPIALHDLTKGPYRMPVDLTLSVEVAEHIEEQYVDHYVDTLCNGKVIAMTHGVPGQTGYHHVNCQPQDYWIEKIGSRGYVVDHSNHYWRQIAKSDGHMAYFFDTGLVFLRAN